MLHGISKQQKYEMLHAPLNNFPVFRNYRNIDFALRCMDILATNAQISMMLNLVKLKQRIFKRHSTSHWPNNGVGYLQKFYIFNLKQATENEPFTSCVIS